MQITFIGGGNMASALIGGWLKRGGDAARITVVEPQAEARARLVRDFGVRAVEAWMRGPALRPARAGGQAAADARSLRRRLRRI
jgi:3-hydroxyisobutyrate dehydrogenase-like beta-hydroxyacid dehydrogenase